MRFVTQTLVFFAHPARTLRRIGYGVRYLLPAILLVAATLGPEIPAWASTRIEVQSKSATWEDLLRDLLRRRHEDAGDDPFAWPESTIERPMYAAQIVYEDLGGLTTFLDLSQIPQSQQLAEAAEMFVALGGDLDTQEWTNSERDRNVLLIDYYLTQGGYIPLCPLF